MAEKNLPPSEIISQVSDDPNFWAIDYVRDVTFAEPIGAVRYWKLSAVMTLGLGSLMVAQENPYNAARLALKMAADRLTSLGIKPAGKAEKE